MLVIIPKVMPSMAEEGNKFSSVDIDQILQHRKKTIDNLEAAFAGAGDIESKVKIMYTLGELRAAPAVKLLIDNIMLGRVEVELRISEYGSDPAAAALAKIGIPSVRPILTKLKENINEISRAIFANVLMDIYGVPIAQFVLNQEIKATKGTIEKDRLNQTLAIVVSQLKLSTP